MSLRPWHIAGFLLLLAVVGLAGYAFWPTLTGQVDTGDRPVTKRVASAIEVGIHVIQPHDFVVRAEATGHLRSWREVDLSAESGGTVVNRPFDEGQRVQTGTTLLYIDDRDERIALQQADAELLKALAEYAILVNNSDLVVRSTMATDSTGIRSARESLNKATLAFEAGMLTQSEMQEARRRFEATRFMTGSDRPAVQAATSGFSQAEQSVERARLNLDRTRLRAPFGGRLADVRIELGQQVAPGQTVFRLLDDSRMKVEVSVLGSDVVLLKRGATARIRVPALDDAELSGTIYSINPTVDETGTARITVAIPNSDGRLLSGLYAYVALETERRPDRMVVPANALLVRSGRDLVFVVDNNKAQWVYVTTGTRSGKEVEILEGLSAGDSVAVEGHFALAHDATVRATAVE